MIRRAAAADLSAVQIFLRNHAATSMFLSSALRENGLNATSQSSALALWIVTDNDTIKAVFGCTPQRLLVCEAPTFDPVWVPELRRAMAGQIISGLSGESRQIATLRTALSLDQNAAEFEETEPMFQMSLGNLVVPGGATKLRRMSASDLPLVTQWRIAYDQEAFQDSDIHEHRLQSQSRAHKIIQSGHGRLLLKNTIPVAMTSFNATSDEIVQIGSVYTPPSLRGQGHARRAVALHLAEVRAQGVMSAVLFALSAAAARAYQSIGFVRTGGYTVVDFASPVTIGDVI